LNIGNYIVNIMRNQIKIILLEILFFSRVSKLKKFNLP